MCVVCILHRLCSRHNVNNNSFFFVSLCHSAFQNENSEFMSTFHVLWTMARFINKWKKIRFVECILFGFSLINVSAREHNFPPIFTTRTIAGKQQQQQQKNCENIYIYSTLPMVCFCFSFYFAHFTIFSLLFINLMVFKNERWNVHDYHWQSTRYYILISNLIGHFGWFFSQGTKITNQFLFLYHKFNKLFLTNKFWMEYHPLDLFQKD